MLKFIEAYQNGDEWEKLCNSCYRLRYRAEGLQTIPAAYCGDGGIEGFTNTGIVYQCYCPEKKYTDDELYAHLRDKLSTDIDKFINPDYSKILKSIGVNNVHEWHLVTPEYKDRRILQHAEKKRQEVMEYKKKNSTQCNYICDDFKIYIKVAEDFKLEISTYIRADVGIKLDFTSIKNENLDWSKCSSEKADNIKKKVKAVMNCDDDNEDYLELVDSFMKYYIAGVELFETLRKQDINTYEDIMKLVQSYKEEVRIKTRINRDSSMNQQLFNSIMDDFQKKLEANFPYIPADSITNMKIELISSWLADCSMQFRR